MAKNIIIILLLKVDIVVGGHTNTFLYTGVAPSNEEPEGPYPTLVEQNSGKKVPVVQAYAYTKYLGHLKLTFDNNGDMIQFEGTPILLDGSKRQGRNIYVTISTFTSVSPSGVVVRPVPSHFQISNSCSRFTKCQ